MADVIAKLMRAAEAAEAAARTTLVSPEEERSGDTGTLDSQV